MFIISQSDNKWLGKRKIDMEHFISINLCMCLHATLVGDHNVPLIMSCCQNKPKGDRSGPEVLPGARGYVGEPWSRPLTSLSKKIQFFLLKSNLAAWIQLKLFFGASIKRCPIYLSIYLFLSLSIFYLSSLPFSDEVTRGHHGGDTNFLRGGPGRRPVVAATGCAVVDEETRWPQDGRIFGSHQSSENCFASQIKETQLEQNLCIYVCTMFCILMRTQKKQLFLK